jgi:hypothetical protein
MTVQSVWNNFLHKIEIGLAVQIIMHSVRNVSIVGLNKQLAMLDVHYAAKASQAFLIQANKTTPVRLMEQLKLDME